MQPRANAQTALNKIKPLIEKEEGNQKHNLEEAQNLLIALFQMNPEDRLNQEEKEHIEKAVTLLRTYLLKKLDEAAPAISDTYSDEAFNIYQALILLAQCFPLNPKNELNQPLAGNETNGSHHYRPVDPSNRYISPTGYFFHTEDVDKLFNKGIIHQFEEYEWATNNFTKDFFIPMDKSRLAQLAVTHPHRFKDMKGDRGGFRLVSIGIGLMAFIAITLLTIATGGALPIAGGLLFFGGITMAVFISVGTGMSMERTLLAAQEYFRNRKKQPIVPEDFSHEESLVKNLMKEKVPTNQETLAPSIPFAEPVVKKPFIPAELRYGIFNAANTGIAIGGLISIAAIIGIGITVATGGAALPFLLGAGLIFGPPVLMPYITGFGYLLYRGGHALIHKMNPKTSAPSPENETRVETSSPEEPEVKTTDQRKDQYNISASMIQMLSYTDTTADESKSLYPDLGQGKVDVKRIVNDSLSVLQNGEQRQQELSTLCQLINDFVDEIHENVKIARNPEYALAIQYRRYIHLPDQPLSVQKAFQIFLDNYGKFFRNDISSKQLTADFKDTVGPINQVKEAFNQKLLEINKQGLEKNGAANPHRFHSKNPNSPQPHLPKGANGKSPRKT